MRILEVVPSLHVGGAERLVALLSRALASDGHDVAVASLGGAAGSWIEDELHDAGVEVRFLDKGPGLDARVVPRLGRVFQAFRPDVVHTHLHTLKYVLPARVAWRKGLVAHTVHNLAEHESEPYDRALQRVAFRGGVQPVAIGDAVAASIARVYGMPAAATIPNGVPVAVYRAAEGVRHAVRAELGLPEGATVFVTAGRLNRQKDHTNLLTAFADPRLAAAHLLVAGEGELRGELEATSASLGLTDRVRFLGVRADVPHLFAAADAFVLSSAWEGNPLVVMEAMAAGLPVIATAVGSVPELVPEGTGVLVPARDASALADAMAGMAAVPPVLMGAAARAWASSRFDVSVMSAAYADFFAAKLPAAQPPGRGH